MNVKILDLDTPNANGRIYPKDEMEKCIEKYKEDMVDKGRALISKEFCGSKLNLEKAYGLINDISIKDGGVYIDFKPLSLPGCEVITGMIESKQVYPVTAGTGTLSGNVVTDYKLEYIFLSDDPSYIH